MVQKKRSLKLNRSSDENDKKNKFLIQYVHTWKIQRTRAGKDCCETSASLGLNISREKSKVLKINMASKTHITLGKMVLEELDRFPYLGSIIDRHGGTDADVRICISKARTAFLQLKNIWRSSEIDINTKIRVFNTIVKPVLLYGAKTWRIITTTQKNIQVFINTCLRRILKIQWPHKISNDKLWQQTKQQPVQDDICQRCWRWIGHILHRPADSITRQALTWNPQGRRKKG